MDGETKSEAVEVGFAGSDVRLRAISFGDDTNHGAVVLLPDVHGVSPLYCEIAARRLSQDVLDFSGGAGRRGELNA